jgi:ATP:ADP antiporter, AAA family
MMSSAPAIARMRMWLRRLVQVEPRESRALAWSFAYFFCLLCGYYILRPLRDEMGIAGGVQQLQWVFTGTFVAMLVAVPIFGAVAARFPRRRFLPWVYYFFITNILLFYVLFHSDLGQVQVARAFFIWTSVFNLFVVSVFWSFMVDLYTNAQARRLFGVIAAGGSAGAIVGPSLTALLAAPLGPVNLLLISALLLAMAVVCIHRLVHWADSSHATTSASPPSSEPTGADEPMGGGVFAGIKLALRTPYLLGICLFIWLYTTLSTFLYFEQAHIVAAAFTDPAKRTTLFAAIDLAVNVLTILTQVFLTGRIMTWLGLPMTLALIPVLMACGFIGLGFAPMLTVLVAFQVIRRAGNYAIARPAREVLFTVVGREAKYKAKNFIDTVVYRGGDAVSGWVFVGLKGLGLGLSAIAFIAVPIAVAWIAVGYLLGKKQEVLRQRQDV